MSNEEAHRLAKKWQSLERKIYRMYIDPATGKPQPTGKYDLTDIGEAAAMAYGWL